MAQLLNTIRDKITTSFFGRRLGLIPSDYLAGPKAMVLQVEDLTTTPTTLAAFGHSVVTATGSTQGPVQHFLPAPPYAGIIKTLSIRTTSTGSHQFLSTANGASILAASDATTKGVINFLGQGGAVTLLSLSTAVWQVIASVSTGGVSYTTTT